MWFSQAHCFTHKKKLDRKKGFYGGAENLPEWWATNLREAFLENPGIVINIVFSLLVALLVCGSNKYIHTS
jgi:hypothetical protein